MNKITTIKIKQPDGSFGKAIDLGAKASNVVLENGNTVEKAINDAESIYMKKNVYDKDGNGIVDNAEAATNVTTTINGKKITDIFESNGTTAKKSTDATNVTTTINGKKITDIFESNGTTAKSATNSTNVTTTINGKKIVDIFESNGTTVKESTHSVSADNLPKYEAELAGSTMKNGAIVTAKLTKDVPLHVVSTITPSGGGGTPDKPIPIEGYDSVNTTVCGENLVPYPYTGVEINNPDAKVSFDSDGTVHVTVNSHNLTNIRLFSDLQLKPGDYMLSGCPKGGAKEKYLVITRTNSRDVEGQYFSEYGEGRTFNTRDGRIWYIILQILPNYNAQDLVFKPQIVKGSVVKPFAPYTATTYTQPFGKTVYGGSYDWQSGVLTDEWETVTFDGSADEDWRMLDGVRISIPISKKAADNQRDQIFNQTQFTPAKWDGDGMYIYGNLLQMGTRFYDRFGSLQAWKDHLKTTPLVVSYRVTKTTVTDFLPTEMLSLEGTNNAFSDTGDTAVSRQRNFNEHFVSHDEAKNELVGNTTLHGDIVTCNPLSTTPLHVVSKIELQGGGGTPEKPVPIRTVNKLEMTVCGKNLIDFPTEIRSSVQSGYFMQRIVNLNFPVSDTDVTLTFNCKSSDSVANSRATSLVVMYKDGEIKERYGNTSDKQVSVTFSLRKPINAILTRWNYSSKVFTDTTSVFTDFSLSLGNSTSFEPFTGNSYTADFGQEIAAGEYDWNTGELTSDTGFYEFDGSEDEGWSFYNGVFLSGNVLTNNVTYVAPLACSTYPAISDPNASRDSYGIAMAGNGNLWASMALAATFNNDAAAWKAHLQAHPMQVAYRKNSAVTTHLAPVAPSAVSGENNIFASTGTVEVSQSNTHLQDFNNPHKVTASQIGAMLETEYVGTKKGIVKKADEASKVSNSLILALPGRMVTYNGSSPGALDINADSLEAYTKNEVDNQISTNVANLETQINAVEAISNKTVVASYIFTATLLADGWTARTETVGGKSVTINSQTVACANMQASYNTDPPWIRKTGVLDTDVKLQDALNLLNIGFIETKDGQITANIYADPPATDVTLYFRRADLDANIQSGDEVRY